MLRGICPYETLNSISDPEGGRTVWSTKTSRKNFEQGMVKVGYVPDDARQRMC